MKTHAATITTLALLSLSFALAAPGVAARAATGNQAPLAASAKINLLRPLSVGVAPEPPSFEAEPPGPEATPAPKPEEWKTARPVRLTHDADGCQAFRAREWVKIHCAGFPAAAASLLAGTR